jgi:hypothetical protein
MKSRKEIADLLKDAIQGQDIDAVWFVIGELERDTDQNAVTTIKARRGALIQGLEDARSGSALAEDEHYESDEYYEVAIATLTDLLAEVEGDDA